MVLADSHRISHVPRYSGYHHVMFQIGTGLSPSMVDLSRSIPNPIHSDYVVLQPQQCRNIVGLGYSPFARHYLGNHYCFLFLRILRCFSSPRSPSITGIPHTGWVAPFGNLRILGCLRLPEAFRSLPRPSSPPDA